MLTFQEIILRLQRYWEEEGALIWQPWSEKVGAGTMNPATILRVLGPEPWNVAYVEPSFRPDDGRYADNPNRMQMHTQFQVILKPDPGDPQERYLRSLEELGIRREEHDIRFVEDNWESPALGAWGLGWEVWLDGMEITQFTYFQQAGGLDLNPPAVEITYGLERIAMYLQGVESVWDLRWDAHHTYGEILRDQEVDYCRYNFELADIERLRAMYQLFEEEGIRALEAGLAVPALDYILRCSHTFNLLDARGAVGVTERALFFKRMRDLTRRVATNYLAQREAVGFPWRTRPGLRGSEAGEAAPMHLPLNGVKPRAEAERPAFLLEIGTEELPATHVWAALRQLEAMLPAALEEARLEHGPLHIWGTPRRLAILVEEMAPRQRDEERIVKGPPARIAFDAEGKPTRAAMGFARSQGVAVEALRVEQIGGGEYVVATVRTEGRPAAEVLAELAPRWIAALRFPKSMRWDESGLAFSRPIRWLTALLGSEVVPFDYGALRSDRITRGPRPAASPAIALTDAAEHTATLDSYGVIVDHEARREAIHRQAAALAAEVGGHIPDEAALLDEVTQLVEVPTALRGSFEAKYLALPQEVLIAVMKKHQRYFPVLDAEGKLMPYFITVRNGGREYAEVVRRGNENVIRARYADAAYFYAQDTKQPLESFVPRLAKLTFQAELGSMLDKTHRLEKLAPWVGEALGLEEGERVALSRAAHLAKADLATQMVIEMTSLQGVMGREYALKSGEPQAVAEAIFEHYLPRSAGDALPTGRVGAALGIADRLDSLAGLFAVGLTPTGSADPYGLRRAALGLVQILVGKAIPFSLAEGLAEAARLLPVEASEAALTAAQSFVIGRLEGLLREEGFAHDVVQAVLAEQGDDPYRAWLAAQALSDWVAREGWEALLDNYARCVRITRDKPRYALDAGRFEMEAERQLYEALLRAEAGVERGDVGSLMTQLQALVTPIRRFFDEVLVMAEDEAVRRNRLALLQRIAALTAGTVDLSRMEGF